MFDKKLFTLWRFRIPFAIIFCPGISALVGFYFSYDVPLMEGARGLEFMYVAFFSLPVTFGLLALIKWPMIQLVCAIISISALLLLLLF